MQQAQPHERTPSIHPVDLFLLEEIAKAVDSLGLIPSSFIEYFSLVVPPEWARQLIDASGGPHGAADNPKGFADACRTVVQWARERRSHAPTPAGPLPKAPAIAS